MIEVRHLTKVYGDHAALSDVSFRVEKGETVGLLGPNGAGKSTTMNMLCGYLEPSAGTVLIDGIDMAEDPLAARRHIGYLPEIPPLYVDMTVEEQLAFACELRGLAQTPADRRAYIDAICERTQLSHMKKRLVRNLSKGYRQRTGLAQLLVGDPEILILDEPTVGLDPKQIQEFRTLLMDLAADHTIIISSHILSEITSVCRRILVFREGVLLADGEPEELARKISGKQRVLAEISGNEEAAAAAVEKIPGVLQVERREGLLSIDCSPGSDLRAEISKAITGTDSVILMIKPEELSLESIYLALTEEEDL